MKISTKGPVFWGLVLAAISSACAGKPTSSVPAGDSVWRESRPPEVLEGEGDWTKLQEALAAHISRLLSQDRMLDLGSYSLGTKDLAQALDWALNRAHREGGSKEAFMKVLSEYFLFIEVHSSSSLTRELVTGYFQPSYSARSAPTEGFSQALYRKPPDIVAVDLGGFQNIYAGESYQAFPVRARVRGLVREGALIPYHSRAEIDREEVLAGRKLEIAYLNPIDAFFLHIQGSGELTLEDGTKMWVGFSDQNGHPYVAVGRRLTDHIAPDQLSKGVLRAHMAALTQDELYQFLSQNPSYVFFETRKHQSQGSYGLPPVSGRTVAIDPQVFPLGGVGYLEFSDSGREEELEPRLVLFQDTGGAIKGARVDLFMGVGSEAGVVAGNLRSRGRLRVLVPGPKLMSDLRRGSGAPSKSP